MSDTRSTAPLTPAMLTALKESDGKELASGVHAQTRRGLIARGLTGGPEGMTLTLAGRQVWAKANPAPAPAVEGPTLGGQCEDEALDTMDEATRRMLVGGLKTCDATRLMKIREIAESGGDADLVALVDAEVEERLEALAPAQMPADARNPGDRYMEMGPGFYVAQRDAELVSLDVERIRRDVVTPSDHANALADRLREVLPITEDRQAAVLAFPGALEITLERTDAEVTEVASPQVFTLYGPGLGRWHGVTVRAAGMDGDLMQRKPLQLVESGPRSMPIAWVREGVHSRPVGVLRVGQRVLIDGQPYRLERGYRMDAPWLIPVR